MNKLLNKTGLLGAIHFDYEIYEACFQCFAGVSPQHLGCQIFFLRNRISFIRLPVTYVTGGHVLSYIRYTCGPMRKLTLSSMKTRCVEKGSCFFNGRFHG